MIDRYDLEHMPLEPWTYEQVVSLWGELPEDLHDSADYAFEWIHEHTGCVDCGAAGTVCDPRTRELVCPACVEQRERIPIGLHHFWYEHQSGPDKGKVTVDYFWGLARLATATAHRYDWAYRDALLASVEPFGRLLEALWTRATQLQPRHRGPGVASTKPTRNERMIAHG